MCASVYAGVSDAEASEAAEGYDYDAGAYSYYECDEVSSVYAAG